MKKRWIILWMAIWISGVTVHAEVRDFEQVIQENTEAGIAEEPLQKGHDGSIQAVAVEDTLYVTVKETVLREAPGDSGMALKTLRLGACVKRSAVCENGWSEITYSGSGQEEITGYLKNSELSEETNMTEVQDSITIAKAGEVLDFPGKKDGEVIGEVEDDQTLSRTAVTEDGCWSRIIYFDENQRKQTGYISADLIEGTEAGVLRESEGEGIFADASGDGIPDESTTVGAQGVQIGNPITVSEGANLIPLGTFRITHYCQCSICCGPYTDGITSTGVTATTNHTIAVDPTQIPYGSKVVINGQVYVAEDCGGGIKQNCIDIYVATHEEGESKGVFYTEVYLLQ